MKLEVNCAMVTVSEFDIRMGRERHCSAFSAFSR